MNLVIDSLDLDSGWSANNAQIHGLNEHKEYISNDKNKSLMFKFFTLNGYVEKTISKNVTGYDYIVFNLYSNYKSGTSFFKPSEFYYKISFGTGKDFYIGTYQGFNPIYIGLSDITSLEKIRITSLHSDTDYLIVSEILAIKDEIPLDIFLGVKARLERELSLLIPTGVSVKTNVAISAGATTIDLSGIDYIDRYSKILIKDGTHSEYHYILEFNEGVVTFSDLFDGSSVTYTYTAAEIFLVMPVTYGAYEKDIILPSISIWGMEPLKILNGSGLEDVQDTFSVSNTNSSNRRQGQLVEHNILIDCEARQGELLSILSQAIKNFLGKEYAWINGIKYDIKHSGPAVEIPPNQHFSIIPKIQYKCLIEVREDLWPRVTQAMQIVQNLTVIIQ